MNIHLIAGATDTDLAESLLVQGLSTRVTHLDLPGLPGEWLLMELQVDWEPGLALIELLRRIYPRLGILVSGAGRDVQACVLGYQRGADFFMNQPVMHQELMAAVHAQARMQASARPVHPDRVPVAAAMD